MITAIEDQVITDLINRGHFLHCTEDCPLYARTYAGGDRQDLCNYPLPPNHAWSETRVGGPCLHYYLSRVERDNIRQALDRIQSICHLSGDPNRHRSPGLPEDLVDNR